MNMKVKVSGSSDHGLYGQTGVFSAAGLPVFACNCGFGPVIEAEYDDTVGFRETVYRVKCNLCKKQGVNTSDIENAMLSWNDLLNN